MDKDPTKEEKLSKYPMTSKFRMVDTIGVPHPYCITPKHLSGNRIVLDADAIRDAERNHGAKCCICHGKLSYDQHETALLIEVKDDRDIKEVGSETGPGSLHEYLLRIKEAAVKDGYARFAFKQAKGASP